MPISPCCRWKSSSSSAAVMRLDVGRALMLAVRGCTGVPGPPCVGVDADDSDCWCIDSTELDLVVAGKSSSSFSMLLPSRPATIDLARARPTLSVVFGSRRGGTGAGNLPPTGIFRGNVANWRADGGVPKPCCCMRCCCWKLFGNVCDTTVMVTSAPELRIKSTTSSCDAERTSSPLI